MSQKKYNVAIVGATGAVGQEILQVLEKRKFPIASLKLLASKRSAGKELSFNGQTYTVEELTSNSFKDVDFALFSAGSERSKEFAKAAVDAGALVIDNSSAFRMDQNVPLVVPEINPETAKKHQGIIANPNCTTILMCMAIFPIHKINPIQRITVSTYQAVSGAGASALEELKHQQAQVLEGKEPKAKIFSHVIADNIFSHDSPMQESLFNQEEMKMVHETQKILNAPTLEVAPTCIRVPIARAHSEAIELTLTHPVSDISTIKQKIGDFPGVQIIDNHAENLFPMPLLASYKYDVYVGRIRKDLFSANLLHLFICGDQLLKGAALNAVQIAEIFI